MATAQGTLQLTEVQRTKVLAHLEELLSSSAFSGSRRRQSFLRYVVEETLAGRGHAIKESNIAVDVFERDARFDAQSESIVRVTGGEVRKRLAQTYTSGLHSDVHIELPVGSYQPVIQFFEPPPIADPPDVTEALLLPKAPRGWRRLAWTTVGLIAVAAIALASSLLQPHTPFDRLWEPYVNQPDPVVISLAVANALAVPEPAKWLPLKPNTSIPTDALLEMDSAYVGSGGALGAALFAERLTARGQHFVLKLSTDLSFADLKNAPTIMVGPSRWTRELHAKTRIKLVTEGGSRYKIVDSENGHSWGLPDSHHDRVEGYCLVTRLLNSESGKPIMLVVGLDDRNTQAGVEFLSDPVKFEQFAKAVPNWEKKNFQVVLHSSIHGTSAGSLAVVASHVW